MKPFTYAVPASTADAVQTMSASDDARYLGGGTNLVDLMRLGVETPGMLVDVSRVTPDTVEYGTDGWLHIGAGVRNSDLAADSGVRADYPALSQALLTGASGQLRNLATVAGNLLQRTRCLYFQDVSKPCNKRELGSGCPARTGVHRDLAILGTSEHCIATHPSDMAVALAALDATVVVEGVDGLRRLELDSFYRLPADDPRRDTTLEPADLIVGVDLPPPGPLTRSSRYRKARDRASFAFALASVAAGVEVRDGVVADVRIAWGGVAHRPWRARTAEQALRGSTPSASAVAEAVDAELAAAELLPDNAFKSALVARLTSAVLGDVAAREGTR